MKSHKPKLRRIKFSCSPTKAGRIHYLEPEDVRVLLSRLPEKLWERLRAVHFNDRSIGRRFAGYVDRGRRDIAFCAFPASVSCTLLGIKKRDYSPKTFGAVRGKKWPLLAVRRFFLYEVFLHELGHMQIVDCTINSERRRFASETSETMAHKFAKHWRRILWSQSFDHPDPVHNPPSSEELRHS
jgi:hypothetical protein